MRVSNHLTHNLLILVGTCIYSVFCLRLRSAFPISSISIPDGLGSGLLQFPAICEGKIEIFNPFPQSTLYVYIVCVCIYVYIYTCVCLYLPDLVVIAVVYFEPFLRPKLHIWHTVLSSSRNLGSVITVWCRAGASSSYQDGSSCLSQETMTGKKQNIQLYFVILDSQSYGATKTSNYIQDSCVFVLQLDFFWSM